MPQRLLLVFLLLFCLAPPVGAEPFTFDTPERTWATFKFALDTQDFELFQSCFTKAGRVEHSRRDEFEKFLKGDGRFAQTSRVVEVRVEGEEAVLRIDFFCLESDGRLLLDNDPMKLRQEDGRWLLVGL